MHMTTLRVGFCLLVVACGDEGSLLQWDKWDAGEKNVRLLDAVLADKERVSKIAEMTHTSESQARNGLSHAVALLKSGTIVKNEADKAKLKATTYSRTFAESLIKTSAMSKRIQDLKDVFMAEVPELLRNSSSVEKIQSKTSHVADRMLREFENKFFSRDQPVEVGVNGANFGLTWGGRTACTNQEGFALHFQYQRQHAMKENVFTFTRSEWHQRYGWIFGDGVEVYGQQNFPEGTPIQSSGLWLVLPFDAMPGGGLCTSKKMNFLVQFWLRIPNIVSQQNVGNSAYGISTTVEFLWTWTFDGTNSEPQAGEVAIGAYVDLASQDWFSFYFSDGVMLMQYLVTTNL